MRIGVDLGGTKIEGVILDSVGNTLFKKRIPTPQNNYAQTLRDIKSLVDFLQGQVDEIATVGIGTPGARSELNGRMKNCNSTCLNGQDFLGDVSEILDQRVRIANDADCFTLSEAVDGAAKNDVIVLGVIIGTGVGGGYRSIERCYKALIALLANGGITHYQAFLQHLVRALLIGRMIGPVTAVNLIVLRLFCPGQGFRKIIGRAAVTTVYLRKL